MFLLFLAMSGREQLTSRMPSKTGFSCRSGIKQSILLSVNKPEAALHFAEGAASKCPGLYWRDAYQLGKHRARVAFIEINEVKSIG